MSETYYNSSYMEQMEIERSTGAAASSVILRLNGPLTLATLFALQDMMRELKGVDTIVDVAGVPYMDSAGLGTILSHWAHTQRIGVKFAVVAMSEKVRVLLAMTKVDTLLPIFPTVADAERSFSNAASAA